MAPVRFPLFVIIFQLSGLTYYLILATRNMCTTAQRFCLLGGEFPVAFLRESIACDMMFGFGTGSFPHPVPYGTRVPKWAFLDVTVR